MRAALDRQFCLQGLGEPSYRRFRPGVGGHQWQAVECAGGTHVDDACRHRAAASSARAMRQPLTVPLIGDIAVTRSNSASGTDAEAAIDTVAGAIDPEGRRDRARHNDGVPLPGAQGRTVRHVGRGHHDPRLPPSRTSSRRRGLQTGLAPCDRGRCSHPSRDSSNAVHRPIPEEPPVMMARRCGAVIAPPCRPYPHGSSRNMRSLPGWRSRSAGPVSGSAAALTPPRSRSPATRRLPAAAGPGCGDAPAPSSTAAARRVARYGSGSRGCAGKCGGNADARPPQPCARHDLSGCHRCATDHTVSQRRSWREHPPYVQSLIQQRRGRKNFARAGL